MNCFLLSSCKLIKYIDMALSFNCQDTWRVGGLEYLVHISPFFLHLDKTCKLHVFFFFIMLDGVIIITGSYSCCLNGIYE